MTRLDHAMLAALCSLIAGMLASAAWAAAEAAHPRAAWAYAILAAIAAAGVVSGLGGLIGVPRMRRRRPPPLSIRRAPR